MAPRPVDRASVVHYTWGGACDGWHLLQRADLSVIAERVPPGGQEVRHVHSAARQFFYVLGGQAVIEAGGELVTVTEGQGLEIGPGTPHRFMNRSDAEVTFLVVSHPATRGDRTDLPE